MGRMAHMLKDVRENKESIEMAKSMTKDHKLPAGTLTNINKAGSLDMKENIESFIDSFHKDDDKFPLAIYRRNSEKDEKLRGKKH